MKPIFPRHGGQLQAIARQFGMHASNLLDFSASINPDGPPGSVLHALEVALSNTVNLTQYPDLEELQLRAALAQYAGVAPENIFVANGFAPLLDAVLRTLKVRECLLPVPCFNEYRHTLEQNGACITPFVLKPESDFGYDVDALLTGSHDAILLANPQNPSGVLCERAKLLNLIERAATRGIYVFLDEAFIDYERDASLTTTIDRFDNLIVFRSVTKCFGVPGLRVAYAVASAAMRSRFEAYLAPWSISTLASIGVTAAVEDREFSRKLSLVNRRRRHELVRGLEALNLKVYPAAANFVLCRLSENRDAKQFWQRMITEHHMVLRSCESFEGMRPGSFRIAVRDEAANSMLLEAIASLLETGS